jgi:alkanesulfonate monooxygenase SsuD/methylene tetrahydromethanopterin reductase-like flavin-dependent oxidoreductase (luciferase family)
MVLVSPVTWRHPAVLAKTAATMADMSGGRFTLGVGTGWLESEHRRFGFDFPERSVRFDMMEEALGYLRAAFSDPRVDFTGRHYQFEGFDMQPRPILRLVVGGIGTRRTPDLAGRYADELNAYPAPPGVFAAKVARARRAAVAAGRDPDRLLISSRASSSEATPRRSTGTASRRTPPPPEPALPTSKRRCECAPLPTAPGIRSGSGSKEWRRPA